MLAIYSALLLGIYLVSFFVLEFVNGFVNRNRYETGDFG